jgi:hypothetical protein
MSHKAYLHHLKTFLRTHADDPLIHQATTAYARALIILANLDLSPAQAFLESHYCPVKRRPPRNPICMLRMLLLMLLCGVESITTWVKQLRGSPLLAAMTGFAPDKIPGIGTCYAFKDRLVNGPYQKPCPPVPRPADALKHRHTRHLPDKTDDRHDYPSLYPSESAALAADLLNHADAPRPNTLQTRMENLFVKVGLLPSMGAGLLGTLDQLAISGDGSILETAASPHGRPTCDCPPEARQHKTCDHPRDDTSETAQWSFSTGRPRYGFGDPYYHVRVHLNGRDLPLVTSLGEGSEADATRSLKALDDLLKLNRDQQLGLTFTTFSGDMHHDTYPHYAYLAKQDLTPIIPLRDPSKTASVPHLDHRPELPLNENGTPLCPGGCPMHHHSFKPKMHTHVFACPAKRYSHKGGRSHDVVHPANCPRHQDCAPDSSYGPFVYLKSDDDPRRYPPIPCDTKRFQTLYQQHTTTERLNTLNDRYKLDRRSRNAPYGLIYLTLANICEHAVVRFLEALEAAHSLTTLLAQTLTTIMTT